MIYTDLFGEVAEAFEPIKESRKFKTMQEMHGEIEDKTCKTCAFLLKHDYHGTTYHKCLKWKLSHSSATDIRLKNTACKLYMDRE